MLKIDIYSHILPPTYFARLRDEVTAPAALNIRRRVLDIPAIYDLDQRLRIVEQFTDYTQVLTLAAPPIEALGHSKLAVEMAQLANDEMAQLVAKYPEQFVGFVASLPMNDPDAAQLELRRAVTELGALGIQLHTHVCGAPLDDPRFEPLFALAAELDRAVWLHPARNARWADYPAEEISKFEIWWAIGWPYDTAACMARLIFSGLLDRYPDLKLITHHGGGVVPQCAGRLASGLDQFGSRTLPGEGPLEHGLAGRPVDYFKRFYADTVMFGSPAALACSLDFFGADHLLFGTDMPFDPEKGPGSVRTALADLAALELGARDQQLILSGNARRLLHLPNLPQ
jgi:uncharacterized protein